MKLAVRESGMVKDSWPKQIGRATVTYSTEGEVGVCLYHNCRVRYRDLETTFTREVGFTTILTTEQLTHEEVEGRFTKSLSEFVIGLDSKDERFVS